MLSALYGPLGDPISGLVLLWLNIYRTAIELSVFYIFASIYPPEPTDNPFQPLVEYCLANNTAAFWAKNEILNNSAAWAILLGCNATGDAPYSIDSTAAICENSVAACFLMSLYRFAAATLDIVEHLACYISVLIQFDGEQSPTWMDIDLDPMFRCVFCRLVPSNTS